VRERLILNAAGRLHNSRQARARGWPARHTAPPTLALQTPPKLCQLLRGAPAPPSERRDPELRASAALPHAALPRERLRGSGCERKGGIGRARLASSLLGLGARSRPSRSSAAGLRVRGRRRGPHHRPLQRCSLLRPPRAPRAGTGGWAGNRAVGGRGDLGRS
jgi:hypothetical protein